MTYYGPGSSCAGTPDAPTEQEKSILRSGLAGEVPAWYTDNVTDGASLWHLLFNVGNLTLMSNLMGEFGGLCRSDFLMNPSLTPPRNSNPFADGGC
ncbi:MAG: hypothetical protein OXG55_11910 [bacterium]|nr:hypothetical protein [bacterium]